MSFSRFRFGNLQAGIIILPGLGSAVGIRLAWQEVTVTISLIFLSVLFGQAQPSLDLRQCVRYALEHSPVLEREALEQEQANVEYGRKGSNLLPQIEGYVRYQHYFSDLPVYLFPGEEGNILSGGASSGPYPVELGLPHNVNAGISLQQVVLDNDMFLLSRIRPEKQKLDELNMAMVRNELIFNVANGYYRIAMLEEKLGIIDYNLERLDRLREMLQLQIENDFAVQSESLRLDVRLFDLQTDRKKVLNGIEQQKRYLKLMMGMDQGELLRIAIPDADDNLPDLPDTVPGNLTSRILKQQQALLEMQKRKIRSDQWPTLNFFAQFNFQAQRPSWNFMQADQPWYNIHYWGLSLDVPVMQGFSGRRDLQLAEIRGRELKLGLDQSNTRHRIETEQARMEVSLNRQILADQRAHVDMAQRLFRQAELQYDEGTIMLREYLEAEALVAESRVNYHTQVYQVNLAVLNLMKLHGTLAELIEED
jgi:outer membrane protein TolC